MSVCSLIGKENKVHFEKGRREKKCWFGNKIGCIWSFQAQNKPRVGLRLCLSPDLICLIYLSTAVPSAPKSLFPVWQCGSSPDGYVTLGCITSDLATADGLSFKWADASGSALTDFVQYPAVRANGGFTSVSNARVKAADWDQSKKFTCQVENSVGSKKATLQKIGKTETPENTLFFFFSQICNRWPLD